MPPETLFSQFCNILAAVSKLCTPLVTVVAAGCLLNYSSHRVVRLDEPLQPVVFETEQARILFESHYQEIIQSDESTSHVSVGIPFLVGVKKSEGISDAAIRNDLAFKIDMNADGMITEAECQLATRADCDFEN